MPNLLKDIVFSPGPLFLLKGGFSLIFMKVWFLDDFTFRFWGRFFSVFRRKVELFFKRNFRLMEWEQFDIDPGNRCHHFSRPSAQTPSLQVTVPMNFWTSLLEQSWTLNEQ